MFFKKANKKIFGVVLNKAEQRALDAEIHKRCLEIDDEHRDNLDAVVLYTLHETFGFGKKNLRKFWEHMYQNYESLTKMYEMPDDFPFICSEQLKKIGIDVHEWNEEFEKKIKDSPSISSINEE